MEAAMAIGRERKREMRVEREKIAAVESGKWELGFSIGLKGKTGYLISAIDCKRSNGCD